MNWFSNIISGSVEKVLNSLDNLFTSDEERLVLKNKLQEEMNDLEIELTRKSQEFEKEITKRWKSDNENFITMLVRPLSYTFILFLFSGVVLFDGNIGEFKINTAYIPLIETLLVTMTIAYFGSRGVEKTTKIFKK